MNTNYTSVVVAGLLLFLMKPAFSQVQFLDCSSLPVSLCLEDPDVSLPSSNKFFLGENHPDATSCSVHIFHTTKVKVLCGDYVVYDVSIILAGDTNEIYLTTLGAEIDSNQEASLFLNTGNVAHNEITWNGLPYTPGCGVYHTLKWTARDTCGNETVCTYPLELYDCLRPAVEVITSPQVISVPHGNFSLHIEDFIVDIKDDCQDSADVLYSLTPDSFVPFRQVHVCDFPAWSTELDVPFWIADGGHDNNCDGKIDWAERALEESHFTVIIIEQSGSIDCEKAVIIGGKIRLPNDNPLGSVEVTLTGNMTPTLVDTTDFEGRYSWDLPPSNDTVQITPKRDDSYKNGVSTLDLIVLQKHLLSIQQLSSPYQLLAADLNYSGSVSTIDFVLMRKLILGTITELPGGPSWRFFRSDYVFGQPNQPSPYFIRKHFPDLTTNEDFVGFKMGDLNYTIFGFQENETETRSNSVHWQANEHAFKAGETFDIVISLPRANELEGFQFTLQHPGLSFSSITSPDIKISQDQYALHPDAITVSWNKDPYDVSTRSEVLLLVKVKALTDGKLSEHLEINSSITGAEAYLNSDQIIIPRLAFSAGPEFVACSATPVSLCVNDDGVRLPANNQIYLGDLDPKATSCSAHVSRNTKVKSDCGQQLSYEVFLFPADGSSAVVLKPLTQVALDSTGEAELTFDSELSPDENLKSGGLAYTEACGSFHRVHWIVRDECGGVSICEEKLDLYDCQAPDIKSNPGLNTIIIGIAGLAKVDANTFIASSRDDCSGEAELLISLSPKVYVQDSTLYCEEVPAYGVELLRYVWIADKGRDQNCDGKIDWVERRLDSVSFMVVYVDNFGGCEPIKDYILVGEIATEDWQTVELVEVNLQSQGHFFPTMITNETGLFNFYNLYPGLQLTIEPERNDNFRNGVSTLDLVRMKKHLLGIELLTSPYDLIAADANSSETFSIIDLVEFRKLILGVYTELPSNKSWRFVPKEFVFQDTTHPWPFAESIEMDLNGSLTKVDFTGIKIGDVNNTVQANANSVVTRTTPSFALLSTEEQPYARNELIDIPISIADLKEIEGFQFTMSSMELEFVGVASGKLEITEDDYALFGDHMTMSWFELNALPVNNTDILFTIKAVAKKTGTLSQTLSLNSTLTNAELYAASEEVLIPRLRIGLAAIQSLQVYYPEPNPWTDQCVIPFYNPVAGEVTLSIYNADGVRALERKDFFEKGYQELVVKSEEVEFGGLKFFTLRSGAEEVSGKMIHVK